MVVCTSPEGDVAASKNLTALEGTVVVLVTLFMFVYSNQFKIF
jgi:hypothetical protein